MTIYLAEDEVGSDADVVGFPNLGACLAVVLQTDHCLYGFHITPGNVRKMPRFVAFMLLHGEHGRPVHLYGTCNRAHRYAVKPREQWRSEMAEIAEALGYRGRISGYDLSSWTARIQSTEAVYVEYRRNAARRKSEIHFKRMTKMQCTTGTMAPGAPIQKIVPVRGQANSYQLAVPFNQRVTTEANVVTTADNGGKMHEVSFFSLDSFTHGG